MKILAIDTAGTTGGVGLVEDDRLVGAEELGPAGGQAERILGAVDTLLHQAGWSPGGLDLVSVAIGPGSFTGLRIGLAAAQGIGFGIARPVVGVTSLELLAAWAREVMEDQGAAWVSLIDARRGEVFLAASRSEGAELVPVLEPALVAPAGLVDPLGPLLAVATTGRPIVLSGDGVPACAAEIATWSVPLRTVVPPRPPDAVRLLARLGAARYRRDGAPALLEPLYIRPPDARKPARPPADPPPPGQASS